MTKLSELYPQFTQHGMGSSVHTADTLADINDKVSDGSISGWKSITDVTVDTAPATTDAGKCYRFTAATTADKTLTLPSVGADDDGIQFFIENASSYVIEIAPQSSDKIWNSYGTINIRMQAKSFIELKYNHSETNWEIISKTGNEIQLVDLKLQLDCNKLGDNAIGNIVDKNKSYVCNATNVALSNNYKFNGTSLDFDGSTSVINISNADNVFDIFNNTNVITIECWLYCDQLDTNGFICGIYNTSDYCWSFGRSATLLSCGLRYAGSYLLSAGGGRVEQSTWNHIVLAKRPYSSGHEIGVYLNGTQVGYDSYGSATPSTAGDFTIGSGSNIFLDGKIGSFSMIYGNPYNLYPNSDKTDTIANWNTKTRLQGVM